MSLSVKTLRPLGVCCGHEPSVVSSRSVIHVVFVLVSRQHQSVSVVAAHEAPLLEVGIALNKLAGCFFLCTRIGR